MKKLLRKWLGFDEEFDKLEKHYEYLRTCAQDLQSQELEPVQAPVQAQVQTKVTPINRPKRWTDFRSIIERQGE